MDRSEFGDIPRNRIQWFPRVDSELCTQCGICAEFCHQGVFSSNESTEVVNPYSCIVGCTGCMSQCPAGAISFPTLVELREMLRQLREEFQQGGK